MKSINFAERCPELVKEWSICNKLKPNEVSYGSGEIVTWEQDYVDANGKTFHFVWDMPVFRRSEGEGNPYLAGKRVWKGFNDLASCYPELANQWSPRNNIKPDEVMKTSNKKYIWVYPYDIEDKHYDFEWEATVAQRVNNPGCPFLSNNRLWKGYNDLETTHPDLIKEWDYEKNDVKPDEVMAGSGKKVWWKKEIINKETAEIIEASWKAPIYERTSGSDVPALSGNGIVIGYNDLASYRPDLAEEWDYKGNRRLTPETVSYMSNKMANWICPICSRKYRMKISLRSMGGGCNCIG